MLARVRARTMLVVACRNQRCDSVLRGHVDGRASLQQQTRDLLVPLWHWRCRRAEVSDAVAQAFRSQGYGIGTRLLARHIQGRRPCLLRQIDGSTCMTYTALTGR